MLEYKGYFGTVEVDEGIFVGRVAGPRDLITFEEATFAEVEQAFHDGVDDYPAFCAARPGRKHQPQSMDRPPDRTRDLISYSAAAARLARLRALGSSSRLRSRIDFGVISTSSSSPT
jgi:predicted HicB family RNase H-like nuclease